MSALFTGRRLRQQTLKDVLLQRILQKRCVSTAKGFTLTEMLVVIVIAAVLAGIAAPGWLAYMNRQRVGGAQTELLQLLREAQAQSIAKRSSYGVEFDGQTAKRFSAKGVRANGTAKLDDNNDDVLDGVAYIGDENLAAGENVTLEVTASKPYIYFNFDGSVPAEFSVPHIIAIELEGQPGSRRCVVIETLLGSMREESGESECAVP